MGMTNNTFYVAPNYRREPLKNKQLRQALDYAAPKERIVTIALAGYGDLPLMGYYAPVVKKWVNPTVTWEGQKIEEEVRIKKANEILDNLGWKRGPDGIRVTTDGTKLEYRIKCMNDPAFIRTAEMVKDNWAKIGVKLKVQVHDRRTLYGGIVFGGKSTKDWDFLLHRSVMRPDPDHVAREYAPEPPQSWYNATAFGWENDEMQTLLKKSRREMDEDKRIMMIKKFQEMFADELVVVPLAHKHMGFAYRTDRFVNTNEFDVYTSLIPLVNVVGMKLKK
jgi:peptide/nickel transport system substrate-binding protein